MTRTGFARSLTLTQFVQVFKHDMRNAHKDKISALRMFATGSALFLGYRSLKQALFIKSEYTAETEDERKMRHEIERSDRFKRRDMTDGEVELSKWREVNKDRIKVVLGS